MSHRKLNVSPTVMLDAYFGLLERLGYAADTAQKAAADSLQRLYTELLDFKVARGSTFKRLLAPPRPPRGIYFWGGVGRGKSFLMDCFFNAVPYRRKKRIHFQCLHSGNPSRVGSLQGRSRPHDEGGGEDRP